MAESSLPRSERSASDAPEVVAVEAPDGHATAMRVHRAAPGAPADGGGAVLLFVPAMGVGAGWYDPFAGALAARGVAVAVPELRGVGASSLRASRASDFGFRELVELDLPAALAVARARHPGRPVFTGGHSLGGLLATLGSALEGGGSRGLVLIAAGAGYYRALGPAKKASFLASVAVMRALGALLGHFPGRRLGFGGREARRLIREWSRIQIADRIAFAGASIDYEAALRTRATPCLALGFTDDAWAPEGYGARLVGRLGGEVLVQRLSPADVGASAVGHFGWARGAPDPVAARIAAWLRERAAAATDATDAPA